MKLFLNVNLSWPEVKDVYSVGYRGQIVGKVWFATDRRRDAAPWEWHLCIPMSLPENTKGMAGSKSEALQDLANSLHSLVLRTPAERLERAFLFSAASGLGFDTGEVLELEVEDPAGPLSVEPSPPPTVVLETQPRAVAPPATVSASGQPLGLRPAQKLKPTVRVIKMTKVNQGPVQVGVSQPSGSVASPVASNLPPSGVSNP
jgi:membrane peptidoglycan carboxypeptidase